MTQMGGMTGNPELRAHATAACSRSSQSGQWSQRLRWVLAARPVEFGGIPKFRSVALLAGLIGSLLYFVPARAVLPPLVESDYAYQLIAAKRFVAGEGLTSLQPVAPGQPWTLRYDFGFLTQWPLGYPLLIGTLSKIAHASVIECARFIALIALSTALAGWILLIRSILPVGLGRNVIAILAACTGVHAGMLINPSTDAIVLALIPLVAIGVLRAVERFERPSDDLPETRSFSHLARFLALGIAAGLLVWFRYAAIFVPAGIALTLALRCAGAHRAEVDISGTSLRPARTRIAATLAFSFGAAASVGALLLINVIAGESAGVQQSLNLGTSTGASFTFSLFWSAWRTLTDFGFYAHRPGVTTAIRTAPVLVVLAVLLSSRFRRSATAWARSPRGSLVCCLAFSLVAMIVTATALFGEKYDYVSLARYYLPARPIGLGMLLGAFLLTGRPILRTAAGLVAIAMLLWVVQIDAVRTWQRWAGDARERTPSGAWNKCYEGSGETLYAWADERSRFGDVLVSNFHEFVAFETGSLVLPVPPARGALDRWLETADRLGRASGPRPDRAGERQPREDRRVFFLLDPDNKWRSYWIDSPDSIVQQFGLSKPEGLPDEIALFVFEWKSPSPIAATESGTRLRQKKQLTASAKR